MATQKKKKAAEQLADWNPRQRLFQLAQATEDQNPPVLLTPLELIELGQQLIEMGTKALTEKRWH